MTVIYGLVDPRTQQLRYIGKTEQPLKKRQASHISNAKKVRNHREKWVNSLTKIGIEPEIFEIETVEGTGCESEVHHIAYFKSIGCSLTNGTTGGEGGHKHSRETLAKRSVSLAKSWAENPERKAKMSAKLRGVSKSIEHRAKIAAALKGKKFTAERIARMSATSSGKSVSATARAKISAALKGVPKSAEMRVKLSSAKKAKRVFRLLVKSAVHHASSMNNRNGL